jgi:hypothetical protein
MILLLTARIVANSNSKDKVFRYAGAATRLSGSQNATSSFGLASGDTNPNTKIYRRPADIRRRSSTAKTKGDTRADTASRA